MSSPILPPEPTAAHTLAAHHGDYRDWHRGRPAYALWAIDADTPAIQAQVGRLQAELAPLLLPGYVRQPHITLTICGFPCAGNAVVDDDFPRQQLDSQLAALSALQSRPFTLHLGAADTFLAAPYLAVDDPLAQVARLRQGLAAHHAEPGHNPDYRPHLTLGLYAAPHPLADIQARLAALPTRPLTLEVRHLSLMHYQPAAIGGRLTEAARFHLDDGRFCETTPGALDRLFAASGPAPG